MKNKKINLIFSTFLLAIYALFLLGCSNSPDYEYDIKGEESFIDIRDGKKYKVKKFIGGFVWFLEDLAYNSQTKYTWDEAMEACPYGWHLPSNETWEHLDAAWSWDFAVHGTGDWWSATDENDSSAYNWGVLNYQLENAGSYNKSNLLAVRCVKD